MFSEAVLQHWQAEVGPLQALVGGSAKRRPGRDDDE